MGRLFESITPDLEQWINRQQMFFVATAPLSPNGHVNCSPKGMDTFRIVDSHSVCYLDLTGSGAETVAHIRENGRVTFMFCAMEGSPKIVRLYGTGKFLTPESEDWQRYLDLFPDAPTSRSIVVADLDRIADSCGWGVPKYEFIESRSTLREWIEKKGEEGIAAYRKEKNRESIDGLPIFE